MGIMTKYVFVLGPIAFGRMPISAALIGLAPNEHPIDLVISRTTESSSFQLTANNRMPSPWQCQVSACQDLSNLSHE